MKIYQQYFLLGLTLLLSCNDLQKIDNESLLDQTDSETSYKDIIQNEKVTIGPIQKRFINEIVSCSGRFEIPPTEIISIHSKVSGQVNYLRYLPGDHVKKGSILIQIENPELIAKQRILLETKSNLNLARKEFERKKLLIEGDATPRKIFEKSQNDFEYLSVKYSGLKKELELLGINVPELEDHSNFQSSVKIYAKESGYVHEVMVNKGQMISPETQLMKIIDNNHMHLELQVLSKDIEALSLAQKVMFTVPGSSNEYKAEVVKINPMIDNDNSTLQVHCHIDPNEKTVFVAGLYVDAKLLKDPVEREGIPLSGIIKEGEDYFAYQLKNQKLLKTELINVQLIDDFVSFSNPKDGQWVLEGAYYIE